MRILVVEDEKDLATALARGLEQQRYSVDIALDGEAALQSVEENEYDLVVLDINLPKINGVKVCQKIRKDGCRCGILMLTARSAYDDRVNGLDLGADDYLIKPFYFPEFLARVRAILRRDNAPRSVILKTGPVTVDPNNLNAYVGDNKIIFTAKEFGILEYLIRNSGRIVPQEELLEHVWNEEADLFTQAVKVHINSIRRKLSSAGAENFISTVKNKGYVVY